LVSMRVKTGTEAWYMESVIVFPFGWQFEGAGR